MKNMDAPDFQSEVGESPTTPIHPVDSTKFHLFVEYNRNKVINAIIPISHGGYMGFKNIDRTKVK